MIELKDVPSKSLVVDNISESFRVAFKEFVRTEPQKPWIAEAVAITGAGRVMGTASLSQGKFSFLSRRAFLRSSLLPRTASD
jgi:hypothetical protein